MMNLIFTNLLMTFLSAGGAAFLKITSRRHHDIFHIVFSPTFIAAGCLYVTAAILNILLLKQFEITVVFPLTMLTYAWTVIIGWLFFCEKLNFFKITAVILITAGGYVTLNF